MESSLVSRNDVLDAISDITVSMSVCMSADECHGMKRAKEIALAKVAAIPSVPNPADTLKELGNNADISKKVDLIDRQAAIDALHMHLMYRMGTDSNKKRLDEWINNLPSAQPEQRYTEEEIRVFAHGISLSLLSKRSSQHWQYDEDTAAEIEFLERLYDKVSADMKGEQ